jgi:hypothetical protein
MRYISFIYALEELEFGFLPSKIIQKGEIVRTPGKEKYLNMHLQFNTIFKHFTYILTSHELA